MVRVLYITRRPIKTLEEGIFPDVTGQDRCYNISFLLLEEGVTSHPVSDVQMFALRDDVVKHGVITTIPLLSYREVVSLVFEVDRVVVL